MSYVKSYVIGEYKEPQVVLLNCINKLFLGYELENFLLSFIRCLNFVKGGRSSWWDKLLIVGQSECEVHFPIKKSVWSLTKLCSIIPTQPMILIFQLVIYGESNILGESAKLILNFT